MSNKQMLKVIIKERLSEAAEEIFALFEESIAEYQREVDRLKQASLAVQQIVRPDTALTEENKDSFHCKEETEQVMIAGEDEPQMLISDVQSLNHKDEPMQTQRRQQKAEGARAEANNKSESNPEAEEEESDTGSAGTVKPFSSSLYKKRGVKMDRGRVHTAEDPPPSGQCCSQMDREEPSPSQLDMESPEARPFSCTVCDRRFKQMLSLEVHMRGHSGQSLFRCTECSVAFTKQAKFFRHMKTVHSIEKPFKCAVCSKCLKTAHAYRTHMLIHTGERPFRCSVCGRGFVQKVSLKNHMVTHTGEKPFTCTECGKNYATSQSLMIHIRLIHR